MGMVRRAFNSQLYISDSIHCLLFFRKIIYVVSFFFKISQTSIFTTLFFNFKKLLPFSLPSIENVKADINYPKIVWLLAEL